MTNNDLIELAQIVRDACLKAAADGFEEAGISGLCRDGAIEYAQDNIRSIRVEEIVQTYLTMHPGIADPKSSRSE